MNKGICKLCGKEGTWTKLPFRSNLTILEHYCPVAAKKRNDKRRKLKDIPDSVVGWQEQIKWLQSGARSADWQKAARYEHKIRKLSSEFLANIGLVDPSLEHILNDSEEYYSEWKKIAQKIWNYFKDKNRWPTSTASFNSD